MAKVIAPFKIKGTLDDLNYVVTADGNNYVRTKGKTGITAEQFKTNPIFDPIRQQAKEFKYCVHKSKIFRLLAARFNNIAKDGSFAGRVNKLLLEILEEDLTESKGKRTLDKVLKTKDGKEALLLFESNKLRPLRQVLKTIETVNLEKQTITLTDFNAQTQLDWPEAANEVRFCMATTNWNYENDTFESCYSDEIILNKESETQTLTLTTAKPLENQLQLTFLCIYFATKERKKVKLLHRKWNSCTIVAYQSSTN
ncbi:hypothetical protein SLW70_00420 [Flavobacterium sp. NG2]|uniref:hypothetical protein n=1 Tax=Flavobacterium sp. NG2 TaxID=3097547 RepID=UPI002A7F19EF|nr:hypothetical protein [Flavobacterium sp. NG2]WPR71623.1 hypothetical protein SLW70_00420 [Flavobacterium sp. NG2]